MRCWCAMLVFFCANALLLSSGCAVSDRHATQPLTVDVLSMASMGWHGLDKQFVVSLRINNPNNIAIDVSSIDCALSIEQRPALHSISTAFPAIPPHSYKTYNVLFVGSVGDSVKLLKHLSHHRKDYVAYTLKGKLHLHGWFTWPLPIETFGVFKPKQP